MPPAAIPAAPPGAPAPRAAPAPPAPSGPVLGRDFVLPVHFERADPHPVVSDPAALDAALERVAQALQDDPTVRAQVRGHSSAEGSAILNDYLSGQRAAAIRAMLIRRGVHPERVVSEGRSATEPVASDASEQGQAANRRVVVRLIRD